MPDCLPRELLIALTGLLAVAGPGARESTRQNTESRLILLANTLLFCQILVNMIKKILSAIKW